MFQSKGVCTSPCAWSSFSPVFTFPAHRLVNTGEEVGVEEGCGENGGGKRQGRSRSVKDKCKQAVDLDLARQGIPALPELADLCELEASSRPSRTTQQNPVSKSKWNKVGPGAKWCLNVWVKLKISSFRFKCLYFLEVRFKRGHRKIETSKVEAICE